MQNSDLKVLVVGLSEAGKTSLIKSIVQDEAVLVRQGDRTVGIEQNRYSFSRTPKAAKPDDAPLGVAGKSYTMPRLVFRFETELQCTLFLLDGDDVDEEEGFETFPSRLLANPTWDLNTRTFTGECVDKDFLQENELDEFGSRVAFTMVFSEEFDRVTAMACDTWKSNDQSSDDESSDGAPTPDVHTKVQVPVSEADGRRLIKNIPPETVNLLLYDFAGQQEYYITHHIFLTERALYMLAFDLSKYNDATYSRQIEFWMNSIQDRVPGAKVLFVGTHADCLTAGEDVARCDRIRSTIKVKRRRAENHLDQNIENAMQRAHGFTAVRKAFAEREVAKLVPGTNAWAVKRCQDMHENGDVMTPKQELIVSKYQEFYSSTAAMSPERAAEEHLLKMNCDRWNKQLANLAEAPDKVYPVSSKTMKGIPELVAKIQSTVQDKRIFPELGEAVPASYMRVRDLIRAKRKERSAHLMRTPDYLELFSRELGLTPREVDDATKFMHDLGEVLYYNANRRKDGLNIIFLKVGFLIDALKCVIRHDHHDATVYRPDVDILGETATDRAARKKQHPSQRRFLEMKKDLMEGGILSDALLGLLWAPSQPHGIGLLKSKEPEKYKMLVQLLQLFEVAAVRKCDVVTGDPSELIVPEFVPMRLRDGLWDADVAEGDGQVFRYFHFDAKSPPPRGLMQRFQVKLAPLASGDGFHVAKDGVIATIHNCDVFATFVEGRLPEHPGLHGFQVMVRGNKSAIWKTYNTIDNIFADLVDQWPGLTFEQYAVDDQSPAEQRFVPIKRLQNERTSLKLEYSTVFTGVRIFDLLGPEEPGTWEPEAKDGRGEVAEGQHELDMDDELILADAEKNANIVSIYRDRSLSWVMIVSTPKSATLAAKLFRLLSRKGMPAWVAQYSGVHATDYDRLMDGVQGAGVLCPILTADFAEDTRAQHAVELAIEEGLPIHGIVGERGFTPTGTLADVSSIEMWGSMDPEELRLALHQFVDGVKEHSRVQVLTTPVTGGGRLRARRLSDSEKMADTAIHQGSLIRRAESIRRDGGGRGPSTTLRAWLGKECGLGDESSTVQAYMVLLQASFLKDFPSRAEDDDNIFHYDKDDLMELGIPKKHAKSIAKEVEKMQAASHAFAGSAAAKPAVALDWPTPVLKHLFKVNCFDILNKGHRHDTLKNLKLIMDRFVTRPEQRMFISHCTQDEGMQLFNTAEMYFAEKGVCVFNPTTEFQKIEASTSAMVAAVQASQVVLVALSPKLFTSKWCMAELSAAHEADIPVVPVFAGDFCSNHQIGLWVDGDFSYQ